MFQFFSYGEILLDLANKIGDFLMYTPDSLVFFNPLTQQHFNIPNTFGNVGSLIIGGGLVGILVFRLIKFFLDIIL